MSWVSAMAHLDQEASDGWYSAVGVTEAVSSHAVTKKSLQASLEVVMNTLPELTNTVRQLADRQASLETQLVQSSNVSRALAQPLSSQLAISAKAVPNVAKAVPPPPRVAARLPSEVHLSAAPDELQEMEVEKPGQGGGSEIARAMLAQSGALTTLVAQLAGTSQDLMADLQLPGGAGTRGSAGRARLQAELALHKGVFFDAVLRAMSRRMAPTSPADRAPSELLAAGVRGTKYLERFGGHGRFRDLGMIQYQLMTALDFTMTENWGAAKDTVALLTVCIEQAVLDSGRFEVAQILTLQEDVPASVFTNRQLAMTSRARAFAPLSDQRWVTATIAFLKELDTITSKRSELLGSQRDSGA